MNGYYPAMLDLADLPILVVGGGLVATRKVDGLLAGGGSPDLLAPELVPGLADIVAAFGLSHREAEFSDGDTHGYTVVIAATNSRSANARIAEEARGHGAWINVADDAEASNFIVPATLREGEVVAALSTGGASPLLASRLKQRLATLVTPGLGRAAARLHAVRNEVLALWPEDDHRRRIFWQTLITEEFLDCAIAGKDDEVESRIKACLSRS